MFDVLKPPKSRFSLILLGSVAAHLAFLAVTYGSWWYGVMLKFGTLSFEDSGSARHFEKVVMIDRTKPLYLPKGFYAIEEPPTPEEIARREEERRRAERPRPKREEPEKEDAGAAEETAAAEQPKEPEAPAGPMTFGKIQGGALKPHIQQVYEAYERGLIAVDTFTVTVSCRAEPDGSLSNIQLVKSSGDGMIDSAAMNLFQEVSDMRALAPLSTLSSLSLTLDVGPSSSALTAVGFASDPAVSQDLASQLGGMKFVAALGAKNADQRALLDNITISQSSNRVSVKLGMPNSSAGDMMRRSFGHKDTAKAGA